MSWQERALNRLPNLEAGRFWWVNGNVFIDDLGLGELGLSNDIPALKVTTHLLTPSVLNELLLKVSSLDPFPIVIWPGEGAKVVQKSFGCSRGIHIQAKRIGYANPEARVPEFEVPCGDTIVIDDVISSGKTALEIWRKGKLKKASLAAWLMQSPSDATLCCYEKIFVGLLVRGSQGKVPINSLSTFLEKPEVLEDYAKRYARNVQEFTEFFIWLKEEGVSRAI